MWMRNPKFKNQNQSVRFFESNATLRNKKRYASGLRQWFTPMLFHVFHTVLELMYECLCFFNQMEEEEEDESKQEEKEESKQEEEEESKQEETKQTKKKVCVCVYVCVMHVMDYACLYARLYAHV